MYSDSVFSDFVLAIRDIPNGSLPASTGDTVYPGGDIVDILRLYRSFGEGPLL